MGLAPAASAAYGTEPVGPAWVPDGGVHAVVAGGSTVYVGGSFTGGVAALDAGTGALKWRGSANADVRALALTSDGTRLLLGGAFTTVGGTTHRKLAAVNAATGAVDNTFKPAVGGTVRDIVVVGTTAYFGGQFTQHNGAAQGGLGAVSTTTGKRVTTFTASTNGQVYSLGTNGTRLFFGGKFTTVNGQPRNYLASATLSSDTVDAWAPPMACSGCNVIWDLTVDAARNRVYTAGRNAGGLYILDTNSSTPIYRLGGFNGDTQALTLAPDGRLYVGGHFVSVGGVTRMLVAEFDVSGTKPVLGPFSANFVTVWPGVWAMASSSSRLYVGGDFTQAGTQKKFPYFAMFPSGTAPADTTAPTVTATSPAGSTVPLSTSVTATFSEAVQGVSTSTFTLTPTGGTAVTATVAQGSGNTWTLDPAADLTAGTTYTARLTNGITDGYGNQLTETSWTFSTAAPAGDTTAPTVTGTSPTGDAVPVATSVTATFSEAVTGVSTSTFTLTPAGGTAVAASVTEGSGNTWTLDPAADLTAGTSYTARLTSAITDDGGNALAETSWTFTTTAATEGDTTAPMLTHHTPWAGAKGISRTVNITATFSEEVTNVTPETFLLTPTGGGPAVTAAVRYNTRSGKWVLDPSVTLAADTSYTVTITDGVTDVATPPNQFAGYSWSFTTGA
ncbi:PQQ enzyme repeat-containing protein [Blastococcus sp. DSM 46786]|uniref:Ig-like domain-containing protein n=1 Tax=Blastococcus sp. DSM 46786 TaxID=1798227 RepID=UPI0008C0F36C|nr:Ig-like domain-containing protein [Blastococcus sp. DSM 46786]SEK38780.1 PQQ enzyme repeat-containing protein [Blastococcus sp. DSM 46786]